MAVVVASMAVAHASSCLPLLAIFGLCGPGSSGGGSPTPAPLLAAGIPAFTALGGGVLVNRLFRKHQPQA